MLTYSRDTCPYSDAGEDDDETIAETVLRQYQMDRLKYYYAVVECDAVETARAIYKECDGQEFLNSGCVMDLRFIPADMEFDEEVKQVATMVPTNYEPRDFTSGAQQQSKLKVTWDQNDPERAVTLHTAVTEEQLEEMDFKNFLASGSSDDESDDDDAGKQKYSELIAELKGTEAAKGDEVDMEITFAPGLKDDANAMLKKKEARDAAEKLGVWDQYLHKKREKKKTARKAAKEGTEMLDDDDDVAIDRNDPFFDEDFGSDFEDPDESRGNKATKPSSATQVRGMQESIRRNGVDKDWFSRTNLLAVFLFSTNVQPHCAHVHKKSKVGKKADAAPDVDMELLLLPDNVAETGKEHFDLKEIIKQEKQKGRKGKKKSKKGAAEAVADDFKVDVADDRFQALFKKAEYAIDPTDAKYKSTKAMKTLQDERTKRRNKNENGHAEEPQQKKAKNKTTSTKALVDSIKRQAANNKSSKAGKRSGRTAE
ncbi:hypothetical protein SARC_09604 [Sphaeroforma arctica JP610]|uniref:Uncharacterized protein n=1 Tax=Sphaeroforma arctica JP610 TaxID=667725 RepID=A0A0L0FMF8_9EUKA|nr:hypothetical protein SARC_09604 [Sphaeroforma arctica JP610]KNC77947.1 hypothetical protein SARC_09604 [Sphaeroforma arctica JP610]|eukprot:XP_014151849.1 hypothetical protein SARC_09604 [Sphaeroforma arctica JP610]